MKTQVCYDLENIISILQDLNIIVVSLDRIGSTSVDLSNDDARKLLEKFIVDWGILRKLANMRRTLSVPFDEDRSLDRKLMKALEKVDYWKFNPAES